MRRGKTDSPLQLRRDLLWCRVPFPVDARVAKLFEKGAARSTCKRNGDSNKQKCYSQLRRTPAHSLGARKEIVNASRTRTNDLLLGEWSEEIGPADLHQRDSYHTSKVFLVGSIRHSRVGPVRVCTCTVRMCACRAQSKERLREAAMNGQSRHGSLKSRIRLTGLVRSWPPD